MCGMVWGIRTGPEKRIAGEGRRHERHGGALGDDGHHGASGTRRLGEGAGMSVGRYYRAARGLRLSQFWWLFLHRVWRRAFPQRRRCPPTEPTWQLPLGKRTAFLWLPVSSQTDPATRTFDLLNHRVRFEHAVDWQAANLPRLWAYNLHYFDFLALADAPTGRHLIGDWIDRCHDGIGWDSFPTSCRVINWVKFLDRTADDGSHGTFLPHIAASHGVPLVVLFGPTDPRQWHPWKTASVVIQGAAGAASVPRSMLDISVEEVIAGAARLLGTEIPAALLAQPKQVFARPLSHCLPVS